MSRRSGKRLAAGILAGLLLAIALPPFINVNRYRSQVAGAISRALGRQATVGAVSLRLFPQPGFKLEDLTVADDPAISSEPILHADEVTAALRLSSLWRGRLEIARLSLSNPSLNLVRGASGQWNLEPLLERVSHTPTAPTATPRPESRPRFPYIEADRGRINLKIGAEKKAYALSEADFALWLASENVWNLRLAARPLRTDTSVSDTGTLKLSGSVQRADRLANTPLSLRLAWERAQLGQLSKLIYGRDRGWRGTANISVSLQGTPADLRIAADASVDDFRRYDISGGSSLRLVAHCSAGYSSTSDRVSPLACDSPVGDGRVSVRGELTGAIRPRSYQISVAVDNIPAAHVVLVARHMKKDLPEDLDAEGTLDARFELRRENDWSERRWTGTGTTSAVLLRSRALDVPLELGSLQFALVGPDAKELAQQSRRQEHAPSAASLPADQTLLQIAPFPLRVSSSAPARGWAWFSPTGYNLQVQGDARVERLLQIARAVGLAAPGVAATGAARINLQIAGNWSGFVPPQVTGTAQLRSVTAHVDALPSPLQFATATLTLTSSDVSVDNLAASFPGAHLSFTGWVRKPRGCSSADCPAQFQLRADTVETDDLNRLLNPRFRKRPWYAVISGAAPSVTRLSLLNARGQLVAKRVVIRSVAATAVSADVRLEHGILTLSNLRGDVLGGKHAGELRADFTGAEPVYAVQGTLDHFSVAVLAGIMRDNWAAGRARAHYRGTASGWSADDLRASAGGSLSFAWYDGTLTHVALDGRDAPLQFRRFEGRLSLREGVFTIAPSKMETAGGIYVVSGTASLERELDFRLTRDGGRSYSLTGTLAKPRVVATSAPETRAALKP